MKNAPAFPTVMIGEIEGGMTLRDYFAAKAMQTLLLSDRYPGVMCVNRYEKLTAERAYIMADAMLEERNK